MMNKSAFVLLLFLTSTVFARPVGKNRAKAVAESFFASKGIKMGTKLLDVVSSPATKGGMDEIPYYIISNSSNGFVIVSNDDSTRPILAYSLDKGFPSSDNLPRNFMDWLLMIERQIKYSKETFPLEQHKGWVKWESGSGNTMSRNSRNAVVQLETAEWGQRSPFNKYCPVIDGVQAVTGCMPTATAILMRYYKSPRTSPNSYLPAYYYSPKYGRWGESATEEQIAEFELIRNGGYIVDYAYDWENMPLSSAEGFNDMEINAVATLMKDCGTLVQAVYGTEETGAAHVFGLRLVDYMGFDKSAKYVEQSWFAQQSEWIRLLKKEISEGRPVLMSGFDSYNAGHAFLADGFDSEDYIRFNWGWNGWLNGYYAMDAFGYDREQRIPSYFYTQTAIVNLKPDEGGDWDYDVAYLGGRTGCIKIVENQCEEGKVFHITSFEFSAMQREGQVRLLGSEGIFAHIDRAGNVKRYISAPFNLIGHADEIECVINDSIEYGDCIVAFYRRWATDEWRPVKYNLEEGAGIIHLKEEITLQDATALRVVVVDKDIEYGAVKKQSKLIQFKTKNGSYLRVFSSENELVCDGAGDGYLPSLIWYADTDLYGKETDQYGYDYSYINLYLSELPKGDYKVVITRSGEYERAEFMLRR